MYGYGNCMVTVSVGREYQWIWQEQYTPKFHLSDEASSSETKCLL